MMNSKSASRLHQPARFCASAVAICFAVACNPQVSGKLDSAAKPTAVAASPAVKVDWILLKAGGDKGSWTLTVLESGATFEGDYGALKFKGPLEPADPLNPTRLVARNNEETLVVEVTDTKCHSPVTAMPFQVGVSVTLGTRTFTGCGGDPSNFLTGVRWRGVDVYSYTEVGKMPTIAFDEGPGFPFVMNGPCGRQVLAWKLTDEGLSFEVGNREFAVTCFRKDKTDLLTLTKALERVTRFDVAADGAILLIARDLPVIRLSNPLSVDTRLE
jgi:heat shock protein HslJ